MIVAVAKQVAGTGLLASIVETKLVVGVGEDDRCIEIYQVRVVQCIALCATDAVRIVTGIAGRVFAANMPAVLRKTFIREDAVTTVTAVTERVARCTFRCVVQS